MTDNEESKSYCDEDKRSSEKRACALPDDLSSSNIHRESCSSSSSQLGRKLRRTYPTATKIAWVKEFQSCPQGTTMRSWLQAKNMRENTKVTYASFRRWVANFQNINDKYTIMNVSYVPNESPPCPLNAMEDVLADFLRIRNSRLRASQKPICTSNYIKAKAEEFFVEMYGNESPLEFRASNGWLHRFLRSHENILVSDNLPQGERKPDMNFASGNREKTLNTTECQSDVKNQNFGNDSRTENLLTSKDIHFFQQIILQSSNSSCKEKQDKK